MLVINLAFVNNILLPYLFYQKYCVFRKINGFCLLYRKWEENSLNVLWIVNNFQKIIKPFSDYLKPSKTYWNFKEVLKAFGIALNYLDGCWKPPQNLQSFRKSPNFFKNFERCPQKILEPRYLKYVLSGVAKAFISIKNKREVSVIGPAYS